MSLTNTDIQRSAQAMPQYREALDFLQRLLDFQVALAEKFAVRLRIGDCGLLNDESAIRNPQSAIEKWQAGQPPVGR